MRQNETRGERPLPASEELFDEAAGKFLVETYLFSKLVLMCNAHALLDCTLTIIEPTVDYGFHEIYAFQNFSLIKSSVSTLGDKRIKK